MTSRYTDRSVTRCEFCGAWRLRCRQCSTCAIAAARDEDDFDVEQLADD